MYNLRFVPAADTFHAPEDNPANSCYCHDRLCLPSGVFDIGIGCKVITLASIASIEYSQYSQYSQYLASIA